MRQPTPSAVAGFTLLEITVVMGLMSVFMMFLIQILFTTTEVFNSGQKAQELATRAIAVRRPLEESLKSMIGPTRVDKNMRPDARLLVQWANHGFKEQGATGRGQVIRATVSVTRQQERKLLEDSFRAAALEALGEDADPEEVGESVAKMMGQASFKGRAEMLLLAWPEGDEEGAYFHLRRGFFLPERSEVMTVREFGPPDLDGKSIPPVTEVLATGVLHLSFRFASQLTKNWSNDAMSRNGPETAWDSARAGWIPKSEDEAENFTLDLGGPSLTDSTDDVFPHYVEVTVVTGLSSNDLPDSMLESSIGASDRNIMLNNIDRLPDDISGNYLKIGSEWVQFSEIYGRELRGVKRGQRGTQAKAHDADTGVRAGKTETIMIRVPHARDSFNG